LITACLRIGGLELMVSTPPRLAAGVLDRRESVQCETAGPTSSARRRVVSPIRNRCRCNTRPRAVGSGRRLPP
jgi:hypothetical protein